ncbi:hypothetical protein GGQ74_001562 [Desulfobaculum xiamenense]|uniref:Uncharacterized protein n=1 Tax=Desulfobaculum xiamenense TaxID=995050 RepID=A0A846QN80_9BACT|nr:hypothetical protein [Desulfobaculum xiamenense]
MKRMETMTQFTRTLLVLAILMVWNATPCVA